MVIIVVGAVTLEEVGSREAFGADLAPLLVQTVTAVRGVRQGDVHHR
jgi:hypothetical protein